MINKEDLPNIPKAVLEDLRRLDADRKLEELWRKTGIEMRLFIAGLPAPAVYEYVDHDRDVCLVCQVEIDDATLAHAEEDLAIAWDTNDDDDEEATRLQQQFDVMLERAGGDRGRRVIGLVDKAPPKGRS